MIANEAKSLTIGNYIHHILYGNVQVTGVRKLKVKDGDLYQISFHDETWLLPDHCSPIALTKEILEGIEGIEKRVDEGSVWHELDIVKGFTIFEGDKNGICELVYFLHHTEFRIQYVHQLQNLYFALTNTELPITLK